ncbi:hypothetical protein PENTCL1PPCAC_21869, partial [Pristionchus entomophagus]
RKSTEEESQSESMKKKPRGKSNKFTYLVCEECPFRSLNVCTWMTHLRRKHFTTPYLAGLALLCQCGHESVSKMHSRTCILSEVSVIKKRDGPIRRLYDKR